MHWMAWSRETGRVSLNVLIVERGRYLLDACLFPLWLGDLLLRLAVGKMDQNAVFFFRFCLFPGECIAVPILRNMHIKFLLSLVVFVNLHEAF